MIATYRLREQLASFDFFFWLVMAKAAGATKIVLDPSRPKMKNFTINNIMERFHSIIEPGPALARLPCRVGADERWQRNISSVGFLSWMQAGNIFERLQTARPPIECKYTITIRTNDGAKCRNSNEDAWRKFGEQIGAIVLEDYAIKPIHLHERFALYAGAKMNFGVCNGPVTIISLTNYPVMQFVNSASARNNVMRWWAEPGHKLSWMLANQSLVWKEDNFDNLCRTFEQMKC